MVESNQPLSHWNKVHSAVSSGWPYNGCCHMDALGFPTNNSRKSAYGALACTKGEGILDKTKRTLDGTNTHMPSVAASADPQDKLHPQTRQENPKELYDFLAAALLLFHGGIFPWKMILFSLALNFLWCLMAKKRVETTLQHGVSEHARQTYQGISSSFLPVLRSFSALNSAG